MFLGNSDRYSVVSHVLTNPPIVAKYVRVLPVTWYSHITLRVDFYGCIPGKKKHAQPIFPDNKQVLDKVKNDLRCPSKPWWRMELLLWVLLQ